MAVPGSPVETGDRFNSAASNPVSVAFEDFFMELRPKFLLTFVFALSHGR